MRSLTQHKNQLSGFNDVFETVKTVEKIAATSIRFLNQKVSLLTEYNQALETVLARLYQFNQLTNQQLLKTHSSGQTALVVISGDKGLVGALWHNLIDQALRQRHNYDQFVVVGQKGADYLSEEGIKISRLFAGLSDLPQPEQIQPIMDFILTAFRQGQFKRVDVLYPSYHSLSEQKPLFGRLLPFTFIEPTAQPTRGDNGLPIFNVSKQILADFLLEKFITVFFTKIVLEAKLSEVSSRMVSSEHAQKKTQEFISSETKEFLKERKKVLTLKQLESFLSHQN